MTDRRRPHPRRSRARAALFGGVLLASGGLVVAYLHATYRPPLPDDHATVEFAVEGLNCHVFCPIRVGDALESLGGAHRTRVDVDRGRISIAFDQDHIDVEELAGRIDAIDGVRIVGREH